MKINNRKFYKKNLAMRFKQKVKQHEIFRNRSE